MVVWLAQVPQTSLAVLTDLAPMVLAVAAAAGVATRPHTVALAAKATAMQRLSVVNMQHRRVPLAH